MQATTSEDQAEEQDQSAQATSQHVNFIQQDEVQVDLQTMTSKLTIEQLETLNKPIGFVDMNDQFVTESSLRSKLQRALEYYNVPGPYIYSNDLKQRIVAADQQRQQKILKLQHQVVQHRRQAQQGTYATLRLQLQNFVRLPAHLGEQALQAQEKEKEKSKQPPKLKKNPIKIRLEYDKDDDDLIYNEPLNLLTFELDKQDYDYSQPSSEARIREFLNQWFTEEPQEPVDISILQPLSSESLKNIR
ncbi:MAG: hypothetical protein EZS28_006815 [Streblomastix strix]|uniref:Uncharacterized protein n=1 Tax=Streblomastix strix TaxID=222440 RepID=A0A5J4WU27_9EUKA|nr:MAG: hypothetical protein EZS28_006815 [Streblomastix strix]